VLGSASHQVAAVAFPIVVFGLPDSSTVVCTPILGRNNAVFQQVNTLPHQGVFHRRETWQRHGPFDTRFELAADYEFLLRLVTRGDPVIIAASLPPVRMAAGGISKQDPLRVLREFRFAQSLNGIAGVRWLWWAAWLKSLVRTITAMALGERTARKVSDGLRRRKLQIKNCKPARVTTKWH